MRIFLFTWILLSLPVTGFSHGGDDGPSSLTEEFSRLSHFHLPFSYSTLHGLSYGFTIGHNHGGEGDHGEHADESGFELDIHPVVFAGLDHVKQLTNQEVVTGNSEKIVKANPHTPYLLTESFKWDLGLGVEFDREIPLTVFSAGIGVSALIGKNYYSQRKLINKFELRKKLKLPTSIENLKTWRVGDSLSYASKASIILNAFVGVEPIVHIGALYSHNGWHKVKATLLENNMIEVQVSKTKTHSFAIEADAVITTTELSKSIGKARSFVYRFNCNNPKSFKAISLLFKGRLDLTNHMMLASGGDIVLSTDTLLKGTSLTGSFGIPIIYFNGFTSGVYQMQGEVREAHEGHEHHEEIYSTTKTKETFTRGVLSRHQWLNQTTVATIIRGELHEYETEDAVNIGEHIEEHDSVISTVYSWSFSRDKVHQQNLKKRLAKLAQSLGIKKLNELQFPEDDLSYMKIDVNLNFAGKEILFLLNGKNRKEIYQLARNNLLNDFRTLGSHHFCPHRGLDACREKYLRGLSSKRDLLNSTSGQIERSYKLKNYAKVTKELTTLINHLFSSRYLLGAFMHKMPMKTQVMIEGERVKRHTLQF